MLELIYKVECWLLGITRSSDLVQNRKFDAVSRTDDFFFYIGEILIGYPVLSTQEDWPEYRTDVYERESGIQGTYPTTSRLCF